MNEPVKGPAKGWTRLLPVLVAAVLSALLLAAGACGPSTPEGTVRPFVREGRAGIIATEGSEVFHEGEWVKHGEFVFRDERGEEISRGRYRYGLEEGPWTQRYEDGSRGVGAFKDGERTGHWQTFHPNGKLQDKGSYAEDARTGHWVSYRDDGTRLREATYVEGKKEGLVTWYGKDGVQVDRGRTGTYENNERVD